jgi:hypothetical protein
MSDSDEKKEYEALDVPEEARALGGVELLRIGVTDDKLFISARPALRDPAEWGEILAEVTRRLGVLYDMEDTGFTEQDVMVAIEEAFAAELGAKSVKGGAKPKVRPSKRKPATGKPASKAKRKAPKKAPSKAKRKKR